MGTIPFAVAGDYADTTTWRYYRSVGEAVWAFGNILEYWDGGPLVVDSCGNAPMSDGMYVATSFADGSNDHDREGLPVCTPVDLIEQPNSDDYYMLAEQVAATLTTGGDPMVVLGWSGNFGRKMLAANARLGSTGDRTLQLGDWWLRVFDAHHRAYLSLERFDAGTRTTAKHIALYKATLRHDTENNLLSVTSNYDTEDVAMIQNVSSEQIEQLRRIIEVLSASLIVGRRTT